MRSWTSKRLYARLTRILKDFDPIGKILETFTKKRSEIEMNVIEIRKKINDHLGDIQDNILKELKATKERVSSRMLL